MNNNKSKYLIGIETSCDETAASVISFSEKGESFQVLSNVISSQIEIHKKYGGVVPEVAAREHVLNILPVIDEALKTAKISYSNLEAIAVTSGPGLVTSLISGIETAKSLAYAWKKPMISINHIEGHIFANFINNDAKINLPAIILTVSGGHTILLKMGKNKKIKIIGETRDDAAGEAYDKAAKMLGLGYPGGPIISQYAAKYVENVGETNLEKKKTIKLPRPMINSSDFDFSFSGLKTALLYEIKKDKAWKKHIEEYCHEYQQAIIDILIKKTIKAAISHKVHTIMLSGGVSANKELREQMAKSIAESFSGKIDFFVPELKYTTDNAAMIAAAAFFKLRQGKTLDFSKVKANPSSELK